MDILHVLLRLIHIVAAFLWVGLGVASTYFIIPAAVSASESGFRFVKTLYGKTPFGMIFPIVSGLTSLAGILLYILSNSASYFSQTGNIVLGVGALAGLVATIHGGAVLSRQTRELGMKIGQSVPENGSASAQAISEITQKAQELLSHSRISVYLMIAALVCMGSARYL